MRNVAGRTALLTGASRGIGEVVAGRLQREGMKVVLCARSPDDLARVQGAIDPDRSATLTVPCDVTEAADCEKALEAAVERFGGLDVLVNNAGIEQPEPFAEMSLERIEQMVAINLLGVMRMTRTVLPHMLARGEGHIVNTASMAGLTPVPFNAVYSATKHGVVGFSESLAAELRGTGVGVSAVSPGWVRDVGLLTDTRTRASHRSPGPALRTRSPTRS